MSKIGPGDLDDFVRKVDSLGGPDTPAAQTYWRELTYVPVTHVDKRLDPFGSDYMRAQLNLYSEISGRSLDQSINEHTLFDLEPHVAGRNPYNHFNPGILANHLARLSIAFKLARPRLGARMLDMGCGWGLSSELANYLGLNVHAVDINPDFVALVRARAVRYNHPITASCAAFDNFTTDQPVDFILFYECLHHAVEPWKVFTRLANILSVGGQIVACGEPFNDRWWPAWGLRLDPLSVYCIHKHGWFESGWSERFIVCCLDRTLLNSRIVDNADPDIGKVLLATKDSLLSAGWIARNSIIEGANLDGGYIVSTARTKLTLQTSLGSGAKNLVLTNFRPVHLQTRWRREKSPWASVSLPPGEARLQIDDWCVGESLEFASETWVPATEIGNQDDRSLAFHLSGIELVDRLGGDFPN